MGKGNLFGFHPLFPESRFTTVNGITFCNLHRTFASRCGCLNGLKEAKFVSEKPKLPFVRCHCCFRLTDKLVPFAVNWSVAFVEGAIDLLGKGVCVDCYGDLVRKTARFLMRRRFPFLSVRPVPLWRFPAWSKLSLKRSRG
jgi:hypothetical protein